MSNDDEVVRSMMADMQAAYGAQEDNEPRYRVGQHVYIRPQGFLFNGRGYLGTITEVCGACRDPRVGAAADALTNFYHVDMKMPVLPQEVVDGLIYEYEIVGETGNE